jgi:hypothetical protein
LLNRSAAEMRGVSMLGLVKNGTVGGFATGRYPQAFLNRGD